MNPLTELDLLLLERWQDALGLYEGMDELQKRLRRRFKHAGEQLKPWFRDRGLEVFEVEWETASYSGAKKLWIGDKGEPTVWITVGGLFPYGYKDVVDELPYVWLFVPDVSDDSARLVGRVRGVLGARLGAWQNDECDETMPLGQYVEGYGDVERAGFAKDLAALTAFVRAQESLIQELVAAVDTATRVP